MASTIQPFFTLTWGDLKNRIVQDLGNRFYLLPQADQYARGRIEFYTKELFYPSAQTSYFTTQPGIAQYPFWPAQQIEKVRLLLNAAWIPIDFTPWRNIIDDDTISPPVQTIPAEYSLRNNTIRFFPVPAGAWVIELTLGTKIPAPLSDNDVNFWTQDAAELIIAATVRIMATTVLKEPDRAELAAQNEQAEYLSLREQSHRIRGGIFVKPYYA